MHLFRSCFLALAGVVSLGSVPVSAENFTTAVEVRPILQATRGQWVSVRRYDGQDLLYFTTFLSWRCGLDRIEFSVNGEDLTPFVAEPCYDDAAQPNALRAQSLDSILVSFPQDSVETVAVRLTFDDGSTESADYRSL